MIIITSIICMAMVYNYLDGGLAMGFMTALVVEVFCLIALYNVLKRTEDRVKLTYEKIIDEYREREKKHLRIIEKAKSEQKAREEEEAALEAENAQEENQGEETPDEPAQS